MMLRGWIPEPITIPGRHKYNTNMPEKYENMAKYVRLCESKKNSHRPLKQRNTAIFLQFIRSYLINVIKD